MLKVPQSSPRRMRVSLPAIRRFLSTGNRWPRSGWYGWRISAHPKCSLCSSAVCVNRRDSERAHCLAVRFRDIDTSKGPRMIAPLLEFMNCLRFLLRCVPDLSVYTGRLLAIVFCHPSNGEDFAAVRVGQQALQGSHLAPSAFLRRLRDTHLESANVTVDGRPVDGIL